MSESHSTPTARSSKPARAKPPKPQKPYPDFPLYAHASGKWAKSIRGRVHYFGTWGDPQGALREYEDQKADLHAGRRTQREMSAVTVSELFNAFLEARELKIERGELSQRTWDYYYEVLTLARKSLGKRRLVIDLYPTDFTRLYGDLAKRWGLHRLATAVQTVKSAFRYASEADIIDKVVKFGPDFKKPSLKTMRIHKAKRGSRMFEAHEIRMMLNGTLAVGEQGPEFVRGAGPQLRAMILLGVNAGFGNSDCGNLPLKAVDLDRGVIDFPRPKTGLDRRCPLWPETAAALREIIACRKEPSDQAGLVFITKYGGSWVKSTSANPVSWETAKLLKRLGINGHRNFYALRHSFRTIADEVKDRPAVDHIMGHTPSGNDMAAVYRERIADERLRAVANHVHAWLFSPGKVS
jgi:integrase